MSKIIEIHKDNLPQEHVCCAIGSDPANRARAAGKKAWMDRRFDEGLVFKRLDERGKVFIEYMPMETTWKPVDGANFLMIHCLWVSGRFKGQGWASALLEECLADARSRGKDGVAYVSSRKTEHYLTDKRFFLRKGFETVDEAEPFFELLALKFRPEAPNPAFRDHCRSGRSPHDEGFHFVYSNQCPFMDEYVGLMAGIARDRGYPATVRKLESAEQAKAESSPFGTLGIYFEGRFLTHAPMTAKKFEKLLATLG